MSKIEFVPQPVTIKKIIQESSDVKSLVLERNDGQKIEFRSGQFVEISVQGIGESTFTISRLSKERKEFTVSVKRIGHLTRMLHRLSEGEIVGMRGPYGNCFPLDEWRGKNLVIIGGGIGLAPLRPVIDSVLDQRGEYGHVEIVFGARSPEDILFKDDLSLWEKDTSIALYTTIDIPHEGWQGRVGFIPDVVKDLSMRPNNNVAVLCGPPIMIRLTVDALRSLGWPDERIYTTLEMKMQCGIGQCGRCNIGGMLICKDGPVFRLDRLGSGLDI